MADPHDDVQPGDQGPQPPRPDDRDDAAAPDERGEGAPRDHVPVEGEGEEPEAPRRAASAEFVVDSGVGTEALLRDAMDPANRSLAEALRLSYRVLQVVILVLLVLFVFSGIQRVEENQSGVRLRWGKIVDVDGTEALEPGPHFSIWPYPIGEFVLLDVRSREVRIDRRYWPDQKGRSLEQAIEAATVNDMLDPREDGSLLTRGGDIAHIKLKAEYDIDAPADYVRTVADRRSGRQLDGDRLVRLALERAVVHVAAASELADFVEFEDDDKQEVRRLAQDMIDLASAGIRVASVDAPIDPTPAFAIRKAFGELQQATIYADNAVEAAREDKQSTLISAAGDRYPILVDLLDEYEDAYARGDLARAESIRAEIGEELSSGEVGSIVSRARSYRSSIEATLGNEARRFRSVLPRYRETPELVVERLWLEKRAEILARKDVEQILVPSGGAPLRIALTGIERVRNERRDQALEEAEGRTMRDEFAGPDPYTQRAEEMTPEGRPGRQLPPPGQGGGGAP